MDLTAITVQDFKNQFLRGFPYLKVWSSTKSYVIGDQVSQSSLIYQALTDSINKDPSSRPTNWVEIDIDECNYITDSDIETAFSEAQMNFNQELFSTEASIRLAYLYLTAHYLVQDMKAAQKGVQSTGSNPVASRSAGCVSESYSIPEWMSKDPILVYYTKSDYGLKYLSFLIPALAGNVFAVAGATRP